MSAFKRALDSTVGQKVVTASTGLGLAAFVLVHMIGNLQLFVGQDAINSYAKKLQSLGALLWVARIGLLGLIALHITMTVRLTLRNRQARKGRYALDGSRESTRSSRSMAITGTAILAFVVFHLAHFTFGWVQPELHSLKDSQGRHDVFTMVTAGFQNPAFVAFYLIGMLFLLGHLSHALFSVFQTLGVTYGDQKGRAKQLARAVAWVTIAGFSAIPLASWLGWIGS